MTTHTRLPSTAALDAASRSLWLATLALMTAFMQNTAPAHRYLVARRIARNFETLRGQECFTADCRARFDRLGRRWHATADSLREPEPSRWRLALQRLGLG